MFTHSLFKVTKSHQKAMREVFELLFAVVYIIKMIFVIKLRLHVGRCSPAIIWFCLWFSSFCFGEISQIFLTIGVTKAAPRYLQFCVFFLYLKFGLINFFHQQALERAQICLTVQQIFGNSTEGNAVNLTRKIPIFFVAKHYVME